jgi:hypothetical protein
VRVVAAGPIVTAAGGYPIPVWGESIAYEVRGPRVRGVRSRTS